MSSDLFTLLHRHTVGDTKVPFCLQSCVKPLKYAISVHDHGTEYVHRFIGKEPSGLRFNKLFLDEDGKDYNHQLQHDCSLLQSANLLAFLLKFATKNLINRFFPHR